MVGKRSINIVLGVLVALVIVEAGALAVVLNDRTSLSNDLRAQTQSAEMTRYLVDLSAGMQHELSLMDQATSKTAADLQGRPLNDSQARTALNEVVNASSAVIDVLTADRNGTVLAIEPAPYAEMEGMNIGADDPIGKLLEQGQPVISSLFLTSEGDRGVFIAYPVFDGQGRAIGAVSTLFRPDRMMENITAALGEEALGAMVLQMDGTVLYDGDASQVGRNTFTDPLYENFTEIKAVASRMVNESSGDGAYSFHPPGEITEVRKAVQWTTIGLLGERWTVAVNRAL
jgi:hypothetical protein